MKKLSIKGKITLWYTTLVVVILLAVLSFLFASAEQIIYSNDQNLLTNVTMEAADEIDIEEGQVEFDDDIKGYEKGVILLTFDHGQLMTGQYPANFPVNTKLQRGNTFTVKNNGNQWLVKDVPIGEEIYIRGIHPLDEMTAAMGQTILIALIAFPFIILIAALGGYWISKKAFAPVSKIAKTAKEIGNSYDLSKRIHLADTGDEISVLSDTFDEMLEKLERAFEDEKQFTSDVSHELRTPIAVLKTQCEYALTQQNNGETEKALQDILCKTDQMTNLVAQLLELSRAQHQTDTVTFERVDISELLEMVAEEMMQQAEKKEIAIVLEHEKNVCIYCEQTLIMRLLINLIENAIKYTDKGGQIVLTLVQREGDIQLSVADTGIGISQEHLPKIFNRFYKVNTARTKEAESSFGFGLAFCKWIVTAHRGTIQAESEMGKGSIFRIQLPNGQ
ncbi:MAG: HAMP domain-containing sensor histidine kinase [Anaerovorax sp.]